MSVADNPPGTAMSDEEHDLHELCCYTLAHGDPSFVHQHVVDAFAAQHAGENDKPIKLAFALVGLYLHVEKGLSGRQVQLAHMALGRKRQSWPKFPVPDDRGFVTVSHVLAAPAGPERDDMINQWCISVWAAFIDSRPEVVDLVERLL